MLKEFSYIIFCEVCNIFEKKIQNENQELPMTFKFINQLSLTLNKLFAINFQQKI